jgi:hypothetical protein
VSKAQDAFERAKRREEVASLYCQRHAIYAIAAMLDVNRDTIRNDLAVVRTQWLKNAERKLDERKSEELARLDAIEEVAWKQFRRSCQSRQKTRVQVTRGRSNRNGQPLPDLVREETRTEESAGDPRYLERISWCVSKRCELLGLSETGSTINSAVTVIGNCDLDVILGRKKLPQPATVIENEASLLGMPRPVALEGDSHANHERTNLCSPGNGEGLAASPDAGVSEQLPPAGGAGEVAGEEGAGPVH